MMLRKVGELLGRRAFSEFLWRREESKKERLTERSKKDDYKVKADSGRRREKILFSVVHFVI